MFKKLFSVVPSAVLAGMSIGFGGLVFLSVDSKPLGALLFAIGLFVVCTFGFHLFTGKVCYTIGNTKEYIASLPIIWIGNFIGTGIVALCVKLSRNAPALSEKALSMCSLKFGDSLLSLFLLGCLCNIFIYIAVEGFKSNPHELGKYLSILFGVTVFILAGTEHCVADMFYFWMAGVWTSRTIVCLLVISLGNAVGGIAFRELHKLKEKLASATPRQKPGV